MTIHSYKELLVWQKAIKLVEEIYVLCGQFPKDELYGLSSQMKQCAISIPSNIAEGRRRGTRKDFIQFLRVAYGSGAELETQLIIAHNLKFVSKKEAGLVSQNLDEIMRMLNGMIRKLQATS